jgi:hypothetical protein
LLRLKMFNYFYHRPKSVLDASCAPYVYCAGKVGTFSFTSRTCGKGG